MDFLICFLIDNALVFRRMDVLNINFRKRIKSKRLLSKIKMHLNIFIFFNSQACKIYCVTF